MCRRCRNPLVRFLMPSCSPYRDADLNLARRIYILRSSDRYRGGAPGNLHTGNRGLDTLGHEPFCSADAEHEQIPATASVPSRISRLTSVCALPKAATQYDRAATPKANGRTLDSNTAAAISMGLHRSSKTPSPQPISKIRFAVVGIKRSICGRGCEKYRAGFVERPTKRRLMVIVWFVFGRVRTPKAPFLSLGPCCNIDTWRGGRRN